MSAVTDAPLPATLEQDWREFFKSESQRPAGLDAYDDIFNHGLLFPLQRKSEMAQMMRLARSIQPKHCLEIGSDKLGSLYHWIKCLPTVELAIALEYRGVPCMPLFGAAFPGVIVGGYAGSSYSSAAIEYVRTLLAGEKLDCVFIDGDKNGTAKDFEAYAPMVRKGGLVFIHDVNSDIHPAHFFKSLAGKYRTSLIYDTSELADIEKREVAGLPPAHSYEGWYRIWRRESCGVGVVHI